MTIESGISSPNRASFRWLNLAWTLLILACGGNDLGPPPPVATVSVTPASATLAEDETQQLTATTLSGRGTVLTGRAVTWSSSDLSTVTVAATGQITGVAAGTAVVSATSEGKSGSAAITVTFTPVLTSVSITPATASVVAGLTTQLTATAVDQNGAPWRERRSPIGQPT